MQNMNFDFNKVIKNIQVPDFDNIYIPSQHMWADTQFEILKEQIQNYEESLDSEHEVGIMMTNFGQSVIMRVTYISYKDPVLIIFTGFINGQESVLIQHINQLNFLLTKVTKESDEPKRRIGFITGE